MFLDGDRLSRGRALTQLFVVSVLRVEEVLQRDESEFNNGGK